MKWLAHLISGPMLWAVTFSLVYGLHGLVCAGQTGPEGLDGAARVLLIGVWIAGLVAFIPLFRRTPAGQDLFHRLPRLAAWVGLGATLVTLFPVIMLTSC